MSISFESVGGIGIQYTTTRYRVHGGDLGHVGDVFPGLYRRAFNLEVAGCDQVSDLVGGQALVEASVDRDLEPCAEFGESSIVQDDCAAMFFDGAPGGGITRVACQRGRDFDLAALGEFEAVRRKKINRRAGARANVLSVLLIGSQYIQRGDIAGRSPAFARVGESSFRSAAHRGADVGRLGIGSGARASAGRLRQRSKFAFVAMQRTRFGPERRGLWLRSVQIANVPPYQPKPRRRLVYILANKRLSPTG